MLQCSFQEYSRGEISFSMENPTRAQCFIVWRIEWWLPSSTFSSQPHQGLLDWNVIHGNCETESWQHHFTNERDYHNKVEVRRQNLSLYLFSTIHTSAMAVLQCKEVSRSWISICHSLQWQYWSGIIFFFFYLYDLATVNSHAFHRYLGHWTEQVDF